MINSSASYGIVMMSSIAIHVDGIHAEVRGINLIAGNNLSAL